VEGIHSLSIKCQAVSREQPVRTAHCSPPAESTNKSRSAGADLERAGATLFVARAATAVARIAAAIAAAKASGQPFPQRRLAAFAARRWAAGRAFHRNLAAATNAHVLRHAFLDAFANRHGHAFLDRVRDFAVHGVRNHLADGVGHLLANDFGLHLADRVRYLLHAVLLHHRAGRAGHALLDGDGDHVADGVRNLLVDAFLDDPCAGNRDFLDDGDGHLLADGVRHLFNNAFLHVARASHLLADTLFVPYLPTANFRRILADYLAANLGLVAGPAGGGVEGAFGRDLFPADALLAGHAVLLG